MAVKLLLYFSAAILLLLVPATSAQISYYCPAFGGRTINWNPTSTPNMIIQTTISGSSFYQGSMNCHFDIRASIRGRVAVKVLNTDLVAYSAHIRIDTEVFRGYLADWTQLTYRRDEHENFVSQTNRIYITFTTRSSPSSFSRGVRLSLTFLRDNGCLSGWSQLPLSGSQHCIGRPTSNTYKFGDAQRYCNRQRSNLLVAGNDNVSSVLSRVNAANVWIGMVAEPSGSYSSYRWINNFRVSSSVHVSCTGSCKPGSTSHRCVYALNQQVLSQESCNTRLQPLCYMPVGGTDNFYSDGSAARASGGLVMTAALGLLLWALRS